jgi:hypothetical protein
MDKTPFAGLTRLDPSDPLSEDGFSFQSENPTVLDELLRLALVLHKHDAHAALPNPTEDPTVVSNDAGGTIPADLSITVGYTLLDANGGETALNADPQVVTTQGGIDTPDAGPDLTHSALAGTLVAGSYAYAVSITDGLGGETLLGPSSDVLVPTGSATNEINVEGLTQIVTDAGGDGWRLWRSINGDAWGLLATGALATDDFLDDGTTPCDCGQHPPTTDTGNTNATNQLQVTVPSDAINDQATQFRIYATTDAEFASPSVLGTYDIADLDAIKTYNSLTTLGDGAPPDVSRAMPGADQIDALTDIANLTWRPPVANAAALPDDDPDGAVRVTLDDNALHIFELAGPTWHDVAGGGGGGSGWEAPVADAGDLPGSGNTEGDVRMTLDTNWLWRWHTGDDEWKLISKPFPSTDEVSWATASLADGATEQSEEPLGALSVLQMIVSDVACRVTFYAMESAATADAGRPITTPPTGNHGVILDVEVEAFTFWMVTPAVLCANLEDANDGVWVRTTNLSGGASVVNVTVTRRLIESGRQF